MSGWNFWAPVIFLIHTCKQLRAQGCANRPASCWDEIQESSDVCTMRALGDGR